MSVTTFTEEHTSPVAPSRIFKASIIDSHNLIPKLMPQAIKSIQILQGDGGAGSIKQVNFPEGSNFKSIKYQVDELNEEAFTYKYTLVGATLCKYYTKGDFKLNEEEIKAGKEKVMGMYKAVEAFLLQNPEAYA
nr:major allergen Pru ar 1-like [Ipomoea batatas]